MLLGTPGRHHAPSSVVVDANTRSTDEDETARIVLELLRGAGDRRRFVKIDSALRGNVRGTLAAVAQLGPVVVTPALPVLGRTTRDGVVLAGGHPVSAGLVTATGERPGLTSLLEAVPATAEHAHVDVACLRSPTGRHTLARATARGAVVTVDAETDDDLDLLVELVGDRADVTLVGSAALSAAIARSSQATAAQAAADAPLRTPRTPTTPDTPGNATAGEMDPGESHRPVLYVVGSRAPVARRQVASLPPTVRTVVPDLADAGSTAGRIRTELRSGRSVALISPDDEADAETVRHALSDATAHAVTDTPGTTLVLVGGQTAREACEQLGVHTLQPVLTVGYGTVLCRADDGRQMVLRPGSFGDDDDLAALHRHLTNSNH
ncbi:hypothetical protein GCM10025864_19460 [Luteimicrobium album]|uniref:4-hydroxythreonine-4-phosphate dehydrogenase n=1 Tax=Luteimicrobium album TaxID=1054550 RepID=A0ABQ6I163_9MICO|nr:four-carbon acid sugar kinase family protein [Luteimicrobium album]GMA24187.1 hypothetical protein GCM10025864_19460 [Luteimicrobium album]